MNKKTVATCVLALALISCQAQREAAAKFEAMKTAIAFYKGLESATPDTEKLLGLKDYHLFGYPALIYGNMNMDTGIEKLQGTTGEAYEAEIGFWCMGNNAEGTEVKLRRTMLVRMAPDPDKADAWIVSRFKFKEDGELTGVRQFFVWLLWMFLAPIAFYVGLLVFLGGWGWPKVAVLVAYMMGIPLRGYVSYLFWGTAWRAVIAMVLWTAFEAWVAKKSQS